MGLFKALHAKMGSSPLRTRLSRGALWSTVGALVSKALLLIATTLVARLVGKHSFGELGIVQNTVGMFGIFAGFGLGVTSTKYVAELRHKEPQRAGRIIAISSFVAFALGAGLSVMLYFFAPWLATNTLAAPQIAPLLQISTGMLFFGAINGAQTGALSGFEAFRTIAQVNLISGAISFPIVIWATIVGGVPGAVWGLVCSMFVSCLFNHIALRKEAKLAGVPIMFSGYFGEWSLLWKFSFPAMLGSIMVTPVNWLCNAMLVNQKDGYNEMGIYNAASQWRMAILFLPYVLGSTILPVLSNLKGADEGAKFKKVLIYGAAINGGLTSLAVLVIAIFSKLLMSTYGPGFVDGYPVLIILTSTSILMAVNNVIGYSLTATNLVWIGFTFNFVWGCVMLLSSYWLVSYGALGLAAATLIAYLCHTILQFLYVKSKMAAS